MSPMPSLEQVSEKVMRMSCDEQTDIEDFFLGSRVTEVILGQNSTFFRGILEKMPSEGLQNCPRAKPEGSFGGPRKKVEF